MIPTPLDIKKAFADLIREYFENPSSICSVMIGKYHLMILDDGVFLCRDGKVLLDITRETTNEEIHDRMLKDALDQELT